jgi:hypothetical protein
MLYQTIPLQDQNTWVQPKEGLGTSGLLKGGMGLLGGAMNKQDCAQ